MFKQYEEIVDHILSGCELFAKTEYISRKNKRLLTNGANVSQRLRCTIKTKTAPACGTCQSKLAEL